MKKKSSKFDSIVLPDQIDGKSGYHPSCYRWFCAVREKKKIPIPGSKKLFNPFEDFSRISLYIILFYVYSTVDFDDLTSSEASNVIAFDESSNDTYYGVSSSNGNLKI